MIVSYNPWLVALSIVVAMLASFTSLRLASRVSQSAPAAGRLWLVLGSISMGVGIWSMHFVGMLALSVAVPLHYDMGPTLLSLAVAMVTSGFAIAIASSSRLDLVRHVGCSLIMGQGIAAMHYIGMRAIPLSPAITYEPRLVVVSIAIAVAASFAALGLTFRLRDDTHSHGSMARLAASAVMGLAIAGMHYVGMAAAHFPAGAICRGVPLLDGRWLALSIAIATFALLVVTLITGVFDARLAIRSRRHAARLQDAIELLQYQSTHDSLTDLSTRSHFLEQLHGAVAAFKGDADTGPLITVMLVDLDRFKIVNDSLGHTIGDAVLREVAARLRQLAGPADLPARMGGDEFLILARVPDIKGVIRLADLIVERLAHTYHLGEVELHLTASVGVTTYPFDRGPPDVLLSHADEAMYEAKHQGGNGYNLFVPGTTVFTKERLQLENDLRAAADLGQLELHYQPQVDVLSGNIVGFEALIRWRHPSLGWIAPDEFIPIAESSDLIVQLGRWVLRNACLQAQRWRQLGHEDLRISINLSARQFRQDDLLPSIERAIADHGLLPRHIAIELTESVVMNNAQRSIGILRELRRLGLCVSVDDFGTGYSSISYLKRLPVNELKIDRSFVADLGSSAKSDAIVRAVIDLAHGLGMTVVAEGVETAEQLAVLHSMGCDQFQGYLFSRSRPAQEFDEMLKLAPSQSPALAEGSLADALLSRQG